MVWAVYLPAVFQKKQFQIINKMMNLYKLNVFFIFFMFLILNVSACTTSFEHTKLNTPDTWKIEKIVYDDKSIKILEEGNFITIKDDYILEIIKGLGIRRYSYVKKNNILSLTSGDEVAEWEIIQNNNQGLHIKTPIGLYVLTR